MSGIASAVTVHKRPIVLYIWVKPCPHILVRWMFLLVLCVKHIVNAWNKTVRGIHKHYEILPFVFQLYPSLGKIFRLYCRNIFTGNWMSSCSTNEKVVVMEVPVKRTNDLLRTKPLLCQKKAEYRLGTLVYRSSKHRVFSSCASIASASTWLSFNLYFGPHFM